MTIQSPLCVAAFCLATLTGGVCAQTSSAAVSADGGTLGIGVHLSVALQPDLNLELGLSGLHFDFPGSSSGANYDLHLRLETIETLLNWYPAENSFHLSAGLFHNGTKATSVAQISTIGHYKVNGHTYTVVEAGVVNGNTQFRSGAPYLGAGWGNPALGEKGWGFTSDLGVLFAGHPTSSLTRDGCTAAVQICTQLYSDLDAEAIKLDRKTKNFNYYPVLRVGVSYSF